MKLSEAINAQKTNTATQTTATVVPQTTATTGKLSTYIAKNNVKPVAEVKPIVNKVVSGSSPYIKPKAPTTLERIGNTIGGGLKSAAGQTINAVEMLGKSPINLPFYALEQYNKLVAPKLNATKDTVFTNTTENLMTSGEQDIARAKEGASKLGKFAVDAGAGATQLAADIGLGALTGGGAVVPMALQTFGSSTYQAKQAGASTDAQVAYGNLMAAATGLVEGISNVGGTLTKIFGKGKLDGVLEKPLATAINRFIKSEAGKALASRIATGINAGVGEGFENVVQDALTPVFQKLTYDPNASLDAEGMIYDALQGVALGGVLGMAGKPMIDTKNTAIPSSNITPTAQTGENNVQLGAQNTQNSVVNSTLVDNQTNAKADVDTNVNPLVPNIGKTTQNIAQDTLQSSTANESPNEVKLPSGTENTTEAKENVYNADVTEKNNNISKLEQALEYQNALYRNLRAEYQSGDIDTRRPELIDEAAAQMKKVQQAETELQKARDDLQKVTEAHAAEVEATAKEAQTKADIEAVKNIVSDLNGRFVNENTLRQIEKIGALTNETAELRKAFDKATRLQAKANQLSSELTNSTSLSETIEIQEKLNKVNAQLETATQSLQSAQSKIANYSATATATVATKSPIFPENSLGAKIKNGMPQGTGAASKNSLGGIGATKPTRFDVNDDMNVDLNNLPKMSNQVVMNPQGKRLNLGLKLSRAYTRTVDTLNPIVKFSKATGDNTAMLASNAVNAGGTVSHIIDNSLVDMNGNKIGKSLKELAAEIPKDSQTDFWNYMMQRRNINKAVEDKNVIANYNSRMSTQYVKNVEAQHPEWKKTGDSIVKWITDFQQAWGVNSGLIDQEVFNQLNLKDQSYVPAQREFSEIESALTGGEVGRKFIDQHSPIKKMEGSERDINNPLENIMKLVNTTVKTARYNQVGQSLLKTLRRNPKASQYGEIISKEEATASNANNIVTVIENGQKQYIRINDVDLLESLNGMPKSTYTVPIVSNLVTGFKKITTQDNPLFGITNLARDLPTGYIYGSQWNPIAYLMNEGKAFGQIATGGKNYQRYKAVGGGMSSFFSSANAETAALNLNKTQNVFQKVGIGFNKFNSMIEEATRLNEFSYVLGKTGDVQKALNAANDVTVNFARGGDVIKTVDRNAVPYLNASIQGLDKMAKAFKPERIAKTLFTGAVGITLPTLILYMFNRDNPYYDELSNRTKDAYFIIPNTFGELDDNGTPMTFFKLPKSRELGMIFGALAERIARAVDGEEEAFKGFFSTDGNPLKGTIATNLSPANPLDSGLVGPMIGLRSNKDFAGRTIVPQSMEDRSAHLQFDEKTSEITKFIAEYASKVGIELSPKQMDYLIDSWTGVVGDFLLPATTKGANALSPITNKFTADPRYSSQTIANFYEKMDEAAKLANDKNFAEGLDSETVTLEEKISSNYVKASKEISALSKASARAGVEKLTDEDVKLLEGYGIDTSKEPQDIQKAIRTEQNKIASEAIARGTKVDEMELDINNNSAVAKVVEKYQSAGITQKQAYSVYKAFESLKPIEGETEVSTYQKIQAISGFGYTDKQAIALAGTLYTDSSKESLLPYLTTSKHLLSLYLTNKDSEMISMAIPSDFTKDKVEYALTDKEKEVFKTAYANYFNSRVTNISTAAQVKSLRDKAYEAAKLAVIQGR